MRSLNTRILLSASVVLVAFLGLTGLALDRAFRESALESVRDRLLAQVYLLLGAAEVGVRGGLTLKSPLPESRYSSPASGLYAEIVDGDGREVWVSDSTLSRKIAYPSVEQTGVGVFDEVRLDDRTDVFVFSFGVVWETLESKEAPFTIRVAESKATFDRQVDGFRHSLFAWFAAAASVLVLIQGAILHWGLAPLRRVAAEIEDIERGERERLSEDYPSELTALTSNLNHLISFGRDQLQRYRNALDDLAHSLKTPLAVLRGVLSEASSDEIQHTVQEQVSRMQETIDYQLQRAAASGRRPFARPVNLESSLQALLRSLKKVYAHRSLQTELDIAPNAVFFGDKGDLTEILGNLLDNAFKWARARVRVSAVMRPQPEGAPPVLEILVEDDGPGLTPEKLNEFVERGVTAKGEQAGQGIGLAVVREIVEGLYGGSMSADRGTLGGAALRVRF